MPEPLKAQFKHTDVKTSSPRSSLLAQLPPLHCSLHFIWNSSPLVPLLPPTHSSLPWVPVLLIQHSCQYAHVPATVLHLAILGMLTLPFPICLFSPACQDEPSSLPCPHSPAAEGHESHDRGSRSSTQSHSPTTRHTFLVILVPLLSSLSFSLQPRV